MASRVELARAKDSHNNIAHIVTARNGDAVVTYCGRYFAVGDDTDYKTSLCRLCMEAKDKVDTTPSYAARVSKRGRA